MSTVANTNRTVPPDAKAWYALNGNKVGPIPFESLHGLAKTKVIYDDDFVWVKGYSTEWVRFKDVKKMLPPLGDTSVVWEYKRYLPASVNDKLQMPVATARLTNDENIVFHRTLLRGAQLVATKRYSLDDFQKAVLDTLKVLKADASKHQTFVDMWATFRSNYDSIHSNPAVLDEWYVRRGDDVRGPVTSSDVCELLEQGGVTIDDVVYRQDLLNELKLRDMRNRDCDRTAGQQAVLSMVESIRNGQRKQTVKAFFLGAAKIAGIVGLHILNETAKHAGAPPGYIFCMKCREAVKMGARICPHCREDPTMPF